METQIHKDNYLEKLQNLHRETTHKSIDGLFDQNPHKRSYTANKFDVSLPDFAEIPKRTPDEKLIRMLASEMNKRNEKSMTPIERKNYFNDYLISYKNKDGSEEVKLTQTAIKHFNKALQYKTEGYKNDAGKVLPEKYISLHPHTPDGRIEMSGTDQIIQFMRKEFIYKAYEKGQITAEEKVEYVKYSCDLLKKMYAFEDEKQNHDELEKFRKVFNAYTTNELTKDFYHKAKYEGKPMIADKSDKYYFSDKRYWISANSLEKWDIILPDGEDIYFDIEARAKDSLSIQRKEIFDPKIDSALAASDIGGIRSIGENAEELNILLAYNLMKHNKNSFMFNEELLADFANGDKEREATGEDYSKEQIKKITKNYLPKVKDKDVLKVIIIKEENEHQAGQYALDEEFFRKHNITNPFVLEQLRNAVAEKNMQLEQEFNEIKKDTDEAKKKILKNVIETTHPEFIKFNQSEDKLEILYRTIKKIQTLGKKKETLEKIDKLKEQETKKEIVITKDTDTEFKYKKSSEGREIVIQKPRSEIVTNGISKTINYKIQDKKFTIEIDNITIEDDEINRLANTFTTSRKEKQNELDSKKKRQKTGRKVGADDRKEVKLVGKLYTATGKYFSGEHQFVTRETLNKMKPTTVAEVYDSMKTVFEEARCFNILTEQDIKDIIKNRLIPILEHTPKVQNGMTGKEILTILGSKGGKTKNIEDNIIKNIFNELTERGLRTLTINGVPQEEFYVKPSYVSRLKRNGLRID